MQIKGPPTIATILKEIRRIKATLSQTQKISNLKTLCWVQIAAKPKVVEHTISIQDDKETNEIAKLASKELVKKIEIKKINGARQMTSG